MERESIIDTVHSPRPSQTLSVNQSPLPRLITSFSNPAASIGTTVAATFPQWKFFHQPQAMWSPYLFLHRSHRIALHWSAIDLPCVLYWKKGNVINTPSTHPWSSTLSYLTVLKRRDGAFSAMSCISLGEHTVFTLLSLQPFLVWYDQQHMVANVPAKFGQT